MVSAGISLSLGPSVWPEEAKLCWRCATSFAYGSSSSSSSSDGNDTLSSIQLFAGTANLTEIPNGAAANERDGSCDDVDGAANAACIPKMDFNILHVWKGRCPTSNKLLLLLAAVLLHPFFMPVLLLFYTAYRLFSAAAACFFFVRRHLDSAGNDHEYRWQAMRT